MCTLKKLSQDQAVIVANIVGDKIRNQEVFSKYGIFQDYRDTEGVFMKYSDNNEVADDIATIIREVVIDLGGYKSAYVGKDGHVYCEWSPEDKDIDSAGQDFLSGSNILDEVEDEDEDENNTITCNGGCDACKANCLNKYENYEHALTASAMGILSIPAKYVREAGIEPGDRVYVINHPDTNHGYVTKDVTNVNEDDIVITPKVTADGRIRFKVWQQYYTVEVKNGKLVIAEVM